MMLRNNIIIIIVKYGDCEPPQVINWEQEGYPHNMHRYMMAVLVITCDKPKNIKFNMQAAR